MAKINSQHKNKNRSQQPRSVNEKQGGDTGRIWAVIGKAALAILPAIEEMRGQAGKIGR